MNGRKWKEMPDKNAVFFSLFKKVCWHHPAMFCLNTSSKLSCQKFEFSLKAKVMGLNPGYLLKSFVLLYLHKCPKEQYLKKKIYVSQSPTGYRKRTAQILRATHFYDLLTYVVNMSKIPTFPGKFWIFG